MPSSFTLFDGLQGENGAVTATHLDLAYKAVRSKVMRHVVLEQVRLCVGVQRCMLTGTCSQPRASNCVYPLKQCAQP